MQSSLAVTDDKQVRNYALNLIFLSTEFYIPVMCKCFFLQYDFVYLMQILLLFSSCRSCSYFPAYITDFSQRTLFDHSHVIWRSYEGPNSVDNYRLFKLELYSRHINILVMHLTLQYHYSRCFRGLIICVLTFWHSSC